MTTPYLIQTSTPRHAMSADEKDDWPDWEVVQGKSDPVRRRFRILQRDEKEIETQMLDESLYKDSHRNMHDYAHSSLVGAPIHLSSYRRGPPTKPEMGDHHVRGKVGGILYLPTVNDLPASAVNDRDEFIDLSDNKDWPVMGAGGSVTPQLNAWSTIVKKPAFIKEEPVIVERLSAEDSGKKKKQKKKKAKADVERPEPTLELAAFFQAMEVMEVMEKNRSKKVVTASYGGLKPLKKSAKDAMDEEVHANSGNPLDSSAPTKRRGKEREVPKRKKPSPLRKVIIREKNERKMAREQQSASAQAESEVTCLLKDFELANGSYQPTLTASVPKPTSGIHSRKFREYCNHVITEDINECAEKLLSDLVRFQDRQYFKDPIKAKVKRRYVCGLKEVFKHVRSRRIKCVILPPDLEKIESEGGINDMVQQILQLCDEQDVSTVFALSRHRLASILKKKYNVGSVGIFYYDGAEIHYKKLMELVDMAREKYNSLLNPRQDLDFTCSKASTDILQDDDVLTSESSAGSVTSEEFNMEELVHPRTSLNIHANEFVPTVPTVPTSSSSSLNINAMTFTPSQPFIQK